MWINKTINTKIFFVIKKEIPVIQLNIIQHILTNQHNSKFPYFSKQRLLNRLINSGSFQVLYYPGDLKISEGLCRFTQPNLYQ